MPTGPGVAELFTDSAGYRCMSPPSGSERDKVATRSGAGDRFAAMVEQAPLGIAQLDFDGRILFANRSFAELAERSAEELCRLNIADIADPEEEALNRQLLQTVAAGRSPCSVDARLRLPDGMPKSIRASLSAVKEDGVPGYAVAVLREITERRRIEKVLEEGRTTFRQLAENVQDVLWVFDLVAEKVLYVNAAYERIWGRPCSGFYANPHDWREAIHPDDRERVQAAYAAGVSAGAFDERYRICRPDGAMRWVLDRWWVVPSESGPVGRVVGIARDVTKEAEAEEQERRIQAELSHRVRNTLAMVQAIAGQTARRATGIEEFSEAFLGRIRALGAAHSSLTRSDWQKASLRTLVRQVLRPFAVEDRNLSIEGPDLLLAPRAALGLSLVLHELAANAAKHGALRAPGGRIVLSWSVMKDGPDRQLRIEWVEAGGPKVRPPRRAGFGTQLITQSVAYDLKGRTQLSFDPGGFRCSLSMPLDQEGGGGFPAVGGGS
ncbi:PAS domain S-box protein [Rhodospirillaceae bacterium SYSU D60014]|uniref:sensor histidine kinase n=1 Tax=Virgifigura deserti TaxID=2268457 RepID=UPI000E660EF4